MLMRNRPQRLKKRMNAVLNDGSGIIENISTKGGFLKTDHKISHEAFPIKIKPMGAKTIRINCKPQWKNEHGVGFKIIGIEETKQDFFSQYISNQLQAFESYGDNRIFSSEILVTLKDTNVFGNVYFSNYIEYQGIIREKFLLSTVPDLHKILAQTGIRLVTVDTYNKFISSSYFGDTLVAELTTSDMNAATCRLNIRFKNKDTGNLVGQGYQRFCVISSKGKVIRIPDAFLLPLDFYQEIKN
ncbi:MAG: thioesterase family protein [Desulfobacula sp.]|nr:thioesterase family protein [Desulfobacula sp.]